MRRQRKLVREAAQARKAARLRVQKAAPELLAACKAVVERWEHGDLAGAAQMCATAIAKAEGTPNL